MSEQQKKTQGSDKVPTYEVVLDAVTSSRDRPGEQTDMTKEEFDRFLNRERANAIRDVATGFIDWDILYGRARETEQYRRDMKAVDYLERRASEIEGTDD